jgi:hypothetical protein
MFRTTSALAAALTLLLLSCGSIKSAKTPVEQEYLDAAMAHPTTFVIAKSVTADAWGRAQSWIGKYGSMKIQTVSDYVIETYNPTKDALKYGYTITKTPSADSVEIDVKCQSGNMFDGASAIQNAHLLAYFINTGKPTPIGLINQ